MLGVLAGIILVQVLYLLLFTYVYESEDVTSDVQPVLKPSSSPSVSLPLRYFLNLCCSTSLVNKGNNNDGDSFAGTEGIIGSLKATKRKRRPSWLLWFSSESSQLLGGVCVAAMINEYKQTQQQKAEYMEIEVEEDTRTPSHANVCSNHFGSEHSPQHNSSSTESDAAACLVAANPTREKELTKPLAFFSLMGIEYCGRVILIPFILLYTRKLMLEKTMKKFGLVFDVRGESSWCISVSANIS